MKSLRLIIALLFIGIAIGGYAQDPRNRKEAKEDKEDMKAQIEKVEPTQASSMPTRAAQSASLASSSTASTPQVTKTGSSTASSSSTSTSQVSRRGADKGRQGKKDGSAISDRQQSFYEVKEPSDADLQWMKVIYREIDLEKGKNAALMYPELPNEDGENLYFIIMRLLAKNQITAYNSMDEIFTDEHKIDVGQMFDNYGIYYTEAKGSTQKNPIYEFEEADIRSNQVKSYYIIEKWEFDTRSNRMKANVQYICPVLHQIDDWSGDNARYPMFWVKLNDIRPYMAKQFIFTDDDNNLARYSIDDFFKLNMYTGDIIKTKNLRNLSLKQMFPDEKAYKHAQDSIEARLQSFNKDLWVPPLEELQARAEAEEKARAEAEGQLEEGEEGAEQVEGEAAGDKDKDEKTVTRTTKRGSKSSSSDKKSAKAKAKEKKNKIKERKPKSTQVNNTGIRSVRNRKKN